MTKDVSISVLRANVAMFALTIPLTAVLAFFAIRLLGPEPLLSGFFRLLELENLIPIILIGVPAHELLHAAGWIVFSTATHRDIRLGFQWKTLTPYAHLKIPITTFGYRMGSALPGIALGFLPYLTGLITGNGWICVVALFFIFAAGGDLLTLWIIRGLKGSDIVQDHPSRVGCLVIETT